MEVKCKDHPFELGPGVCAPCLRSRLVAVIAAQQSASASAISPTSQPSSSSSNHHQHGYRNNHHPYNNPAGVEADVLRSASPTTSHRRKSFDESVFPYNKPHPLFYSTPQVAPRPAAAAAAGSGRRRFAVIKSLFKVDRARDKHRPEHGSDPQDASFPIPTDQHHLPSATASAPATSWFTALIPRLGRSGRGHRHRDPEADISTELPSTHPQFFSSPAWRAPPQTPAWTAAASHPQKTTGGSGFSMCLSPLVRANPGHRKNQVVSGEIGISGELNTCGRRRGRQQPDGAAALGPNRSRKLVDIGRRR